MSSRIIIAFAIILSSFNALYAADTSSEDNFSLTPRVGGVLRGRWEMATSDGLAGNNSFELRNARVSVSGNVARPIQYFVNVDFCDRGKILFLDGWGRFEVMPWLKIQAGQFRIPFGQDSFRGPGTYIFANRSFIGRDIANNRAVGIQAMTTIPGSGLCVNTGVFSNHSISDHDRFSRKMTYAVKASYDIKPLKFTAGFQTIEPDSIRINMTDAAVTLSLGTFTVEAEYMYKHYSHGTHRPCHAYLAWADYRVPLHRGLFRQLSFQGRFEGHNGHSSGIRDGSLKFTTDHPERQRLTVGTTLTYVYKGVRCDLVLDYEKYFYHNGYMPAFNRADKLLAEFVIAF